MKRCPPLLLTMKMQIKVQMRNHLNPNRWYNYQSLMDCLSSCLTLCPLGLTLVVTHGWLVAGTGWGWGEVHLSSLPAAADSSCPALLCPLSQCPWRGGAHLLLPVPGFLTTSVPSHPHLLFGKKSVGQCLFKEQSPFCWDPD